MHFYGCGIIQRRSLGILIRRHDHVFKQVTKAPRLQASGMIMIILWSLYPTKLSIPFADNSLLPTCRLDTISKFIACIINNTQDLIHDATLTSTVRLSSTIV